MSTSLPLIRYIRRAQVQPHNGGMTREVIDSGALRAVENIKLFLDGRPRDVVVPPPGR